MPEKWLNPVLKDSFARTDLSPVQEHMNVWNYK